jgi:hypothetical protein
MNEDGTIEGYVSPQANPLPQLFLRILRDGLQSGAPSGCRNCVEKDYAH